MARRAPALLSEWIPMERRRSAAHGCAGKTPVALRSPSWLLRFQLRPTAMQSRCNLITTTGDSRHEGGQAVGWPVMGFPWTPSGGSAWDWIVDLSNRWNGQLGQRFALTDQWNYRRGGNFIDRCATVGENSGKLAIINFFSHNFQTTTAIIYMETALDRNLQMGCQVKRQRTEN